MYNYNFTINLEVTILVKQRLAIYT